MITRILTRAWVSEARRNLRCVKFGAYGRGFDVGWLRGLGEDGVAALLTRRPDVLLRRPRSLPELAEVLREPDSVLGAIRHLSLPGVQVAEAIAAMGNVTTRAALDALLGTSEPAVDRALESLVELGLLIRDEDGLLLVDTVRELFGDPLGLSWSAAELVALLSVTEMKTICGRLGVPVAATRKSELVATLLAALRDFDRVRAVAGESPQAMQDMLRHLARSGEGVAQQRPYALRPNEITPLEWAAERGLLMRNHPWSEVWVMPAEVALALRGPDYHARFDAQPPLCPRADVSETVVARDSAAAAGALLRVMTSLLDGASRARIAMLKSGGVGMREVKRLAKAHGAEPEAVRLGLEIAFQAGLLHAKDGFAAPTDRYDQWLEQEPVDRLIELIVEWWFMPHTPTAGADAVDTESAELRVALLHHLAAEPGAPVDPDAFVARLMWLRPAVLSGGRGVAAPIATAIWGEAARLGLIGAGAVSPAGRALLAADPAELSLALADVGSVVRTAHLQADLTAVVTGTPAPSLAETLDSAADRESATTAATWRFSPGSVRRALDAGRGPDELIRELKAIASNSVPQTLEYLIRDVARRHGAIRASVVACCLRGEDPTLLAELVADRKLAPLRLHLLAPTVAASALPLADTIAALRAAGYAPVEEAEDGSTVVEPVNVLRIATPRRPESTAVERLSTVRRAALGRAAMPRQADRALVADMFARRDPVLPPISLDDDDLDAIVDGPGERNDPRAPWRREPGAPWSPYGPPWRRRRY